MHRVFAAAFAEAAGIGAAFGGGIVWVGAYAVGGPLYEAVAGAFAVPLTAVVAVVAAVAFHESITAAIIWIRSSGALGAAFIGGLVWAVGWAAVVWAYTQLLLGLAVGAAGGAVGGVIGGAVLAAITGAYERRTGEEE